MQTKIFDKVKSPDEVLDFVFDFTNELAAGDTIVSQTVNVRPYDDLSLGNTTRSGAKVTQWVSGGLPYTAPHLVCDIITSLGRTHSLVWIIPIGAA